jgi:hypothetical protein
MTLLTLTSFCLFAAASLTEAVNRYRAATARTAPVRQSARSR